MEPAKPLKTTQNQRDSHATSHRRPCTQISHKPVVLMHLSMVCPRTGGRGEPTGIRLRKTHAGGDFDNHNGPQGGKFESTAILKS